MRHGIICLPLYLYLLWWDFPIIASCSHYCVFISSHNLVLGSDCHSNLLSSLSVITSACSLTEVWSHIFRTHDHMSIFWHTMSSVCWMSVHYAATVLSWSAASSKAELSAETSQLLWNRLAPPPPGCCHLTALDLWSLMPSRFPPLHFKLHYLESNTAVKFYSRILEKCWGKDHRSHIKSLDEWKL